MPALLGCYAGPLKVGPIGGPETSVHNYQSTLQNIPEKGRSQSTCYSVPTKCVLWSGAVVAEVCAGVAGLFAVTETY